SQLSDRHEAPALAILHPGATAPEKGLRRRTELVPSFWESGATGRRGGPRARQPNPTAPNGRSAFWIERTVASHLIDGDPVMAELAYLVGYGSLINAETWGFHADKLLRAKLRGYERVYNVVCDPKPSRGLGMTASGVVPNPGKHINVVLIEILWQSL